MKSLKKLIMLILFLLVGLFMVGMGVMSTLNLNYSQSAMSELRLRQIKETFYANLDRIDTHHKLMEKNTEVLARLGEAFLRMKQQYKRDFRKELETELTKKIQDFPEAFGGGVWFEPYVYAPDTRYFAPYAYWDKNRVRLNWDYSGEAYAYPEQDWYRAALPPDWDRGQARPDDFYWTAAYYNPVLQDVVVTLATFMRDDDGRLVGLASTDWRADEIIKRVSGVDVTPSSFSFLIDGKNRKLSSLSQEDSLAAQSLLAAISVEEFTRQPWPADILADGQLKSPMQSKPLRVDGREYALFFSKTRAGMVFGICVPQDEIDSVLEPMRETNYRIAALTGLVLLVLSGIILYIVAGIMRLLETLYTDALTGLPNRAKLVQDTKAPQHESLVILNIDAFKEINDFYGHPCGDSILRGLAGAFQDFLAGQGSCAGGTLYKLSADEFAVLFRAKIAPARLEECMCALSVFAAGRVFRWEEQDITLNITLGGAGAVQGLPKAEATGEKFLSSANIALKLARQQRKHYLIYDPSLKVREEYEQNILWAKRLKAALQEDRIVPHFQPILNNRSGRIEKFECLVRLLDEQGQAVGPGQFLHVAKKLRLYRDITRIMVEKCFAVFQDQPYEFSLNLSYEDLSDPEVTDYLKRKLRESGIAKRVIFEILESEGIENYQQVRAFIEEVKALGCKIPIDDFGSGYSNFEHLLRLNADIIKIDGSLIRNLDSDPNAWIITQGITRFARELKMQTVAEFVHSQAVLEKVVALGIDYSQGAYIGMPSDSLQATPCYTDEAAT